MAGMSTHEISNAVDIADSIMSEQSARLSTTSMVTQTVTGSEIEFGPAPGKIRIP